jgi:hypothetical protein
MSLIALFSQDKNINQFSTKRGCIKSPIQPLFIRVPDGESFHLGDSQSLLFTFETSSFCTE